MVTLATTTPIPSPTIPLPTPPEPMIPIYCCSTKCLKASCWQGIFMCADAYEASTVDRRVSTLIKPDEEHPDYWNNQLNSGNKQLLTPAVLSQLGAERSMLELSEEPGHV
jgi:hypothetical protein